MRMLTKDTYVNLDITTITSEGFLIVQCPVTAFDVRETLDGRELVANVQFRVLLNILDRDKVRESLLDDSSDKVALLPIIFFDESVVEPEFLNGLKEREIKNV